MKNANPVLKAQPLQPDVAGCRQCLKEGPTWLGFALMFLSFPPSGEWARGLLTEAREALKSYQLKASPQPWAIKQG